MTPVRRVLITWIALMPALALAQAPNQAALPPLPVGQVISKVPCLANSSESYSLYLPSNYAPTKAWPIIYAFDPDARGETPVRLFHEAAEKYGYIVAGSNNVRNFSPNIGEALGALWQDTHMRLAIDPARSYMAGFSGGARVAGEAAILCAQCRIAAVIAEGAGYPDEAHPEKCDAVPYFLAVGDRDFNWPEMVKLRRHREDAGASYSASIFQGGHEWAPTAVQEEAVEWIRLKAMQAGAEPKDPRFIAQMLARTQQEADDATKRGNAIAELGADRSLVSDFDGLAVVAPLRAKLQELKHSAALKQALKKEDAAISEQQNIYEQVASQIDSLPQADGSQLLDARMAAVSAMKDLKAKAAGDKDEEKRLVALRAFNQLSLHTIELGQSELAHKHLPQAANHFELMSEVTPEEPWLQTLLAETSLAQGDKRRAIQYLHAAVKLGLKDAEVLEQDENLQALHSDPEFQQMVAALKAPAVAAEDPAPPAKRD